MDSLETVALLHKVALKNLEEKFTQSLISAEHFQCQEMIEIQTAVLYEMSLIL